MIFRGRKSCLAALLILSLGLWFVLSTPQDAAALSVTDYFSISYSTQISAQQVTGSEVFHAVVTGTAKCGKDLPLTVSEASVTSRIIAEHQNSGMRVVLNPGYTLAIAPFPCKKGETIKRTVEVPLAFPAGTAPGTYIIIGQLVEAKARAVLWVNVSDYLPSVKMVGSVVYQLQAAPPTPSPTPGGGDTTGDGSTAGGGSDGGSSSDSGYAGGGGGGDYEAEEPPAPPRPRPGVTSLSDYVSRDGVFLKPFTLQVPDGSLKVSIAENSTGLTPRGAALCEIAVTHTEGEPTAPTGASVIGVPFQLEPAGATFSQPVTLTFTYNREAIPDGADESRLVVACRDTPSDSWTVLEQCSVDTGAATVSVMADRLAEFSLLIPARPADFIVRDLRVTPDEPRVGDSAAISATILNSGDLAGRYEAILLLGGAPGASREVLIAGGKNAEVRFAVTCDTVGEKRINIGSAVGKLAVKEALPAPLPVAPARLTVDKLTLVPDRIAPGEPVTVRLFMTNTGDLPGERQVEIMVDGVLVLHSSVSLDGHTGQEFNFTVTGSGGGLHRLTAGGLSADLYVNKPETGMWIPGSIIAGLLCLITVVFFAARR